MGTKSIKEKNECSCCYSINCCKIYNRTGLLLFVLLAILQIVSLATPWQAFYLSKTYESGDTEQLEMHFYLGGITVGHTYTPTGGESKDNYVYCSYEDSKAVAIKDSIVTLMNSTLCPKLTFVPSLFHGGVTSTGILTIIFAILMVIWFAYRTTITGIKRLFRQRCCTQLISVVLSVLILSFAIPGMSLVGDQFGHSVWQDFGTTFWESWGCDLNYNYFYCSSSSSCTDNYRDYCNSAYNSDTGFIIACVNIGLYVVFCIYSWIGSWCCACCCPGVEEEVFPTASVSVHYTGLPTETITTTGITPVNNYTLYVHHGAQFPSKLIVNVSSLEELHNTIMTNLGIMAPFKVAVFDDICQQYVLVSSLQLIPPQATIQLLFN